MGEENPGQVSEEVRAKLLAHFKAHDGDHGEGWSELWKANFKPWDKGFPCPELEDAFEKDKVESGKLPSGERKTALVPGCGVGYDCVTLANNGYDAVGLEIAPLAIEAAQKYFVEHPAKDGSAKVVNGDFYGSFPGREGKFDVVFDYTFFCAMPPSRRPDWAKQMKDLVKPGGKLVCLEFPLGKPAHTEGPPWGVTEEIYVELLEKNGFKRVDRFLPDRIHAIGIGKTMCSIWVRDNESSVRSDKL